MEKLSIRLDMTRMTLGDLEDFEEAVGQPLPDVLKAVPVIDDDGNKVLDGDGRPEMAVNLTAKQMRHLVWIIKRQEDPSFTADDARNIAVTGLEILGPEGDDEGKDESESATTA